MKRRDWDRVRTEITKFRNVKDLTDYLADDIEEDEEVFRRRKKKDNKNENYSDKRSTS